MNCAPAAAASAGSTMSGWVTVEATKAIQIGKKI
jgi:hypothetical protein